MRASAARGSPWLPVHSATTLSGGRCRRPRRRGTPARRRDSRVSRATWMTRSMARPTTTTSRPAARAASATARMRADVGGEGRDRDAARRARSARRSVFATSASDGERPSRTALVESPISASTPSLPSARSFASSVGGPMTGSDRASSRRCAARCQRRADDQRVGFRDRMRDRDELDVERPEREAAAERHDLHRDFGRARLAQALGPSSAAVNGVA